MPVASKSRSESRKKWREEKRKDPAWMEAERESKRKYQRRKRATDPAWCEKESKRMVEYLRANEEQQERQRLTAAKWRAKKRKSAAWRKKESERVKAYNARKRAEAIGKA